jgi:hypothetical protein
MTSVTVVAHELLQAAMLDGVKVEVAPVGKPDIVKLIAVGKIVEGLAGLIVNV